MSNKVRRTALALISGFLGGALWTLATGALALWAHSGVLQ